MNVRGFSARLGLGALLVAGFSSSARAEGPAIEPSTGQTAKSRSTEHEASRRERAKQLYEQAAQAYAERRNFEAIELFRQSAELEPSALLSYNIALAYEEAGDIKNALKYFREYLSQAPAAEDVSTVKASVGKLEHKLAQLGVQQLTVTSEPSGATVEVDGVVAGVTPFTGEFTPGVHQIVLRRAQHADGTASVELPSDRAIRVSLTLERVHDDNDASRSRQQDAEATGLKRVQPLTWGLLGVGAGSLTAGLLFEMSRAKSEREADAANSAVDAAEAQGAADGKQLSSLFLLGAGGAFLVTGGVLAAIELSGSGAEEGSTKQSALPRARQAALGCTVGFCGVQLRGNF